MKNKANSFLKLVAGLNPKFTAIAYYAFAVFVGTQLLPSATNANVKNNVKLIAQERTTDAIRADAERLTQEGLELFKESNVESLRQAIVKWSEALTLWRQVGDKQWEARLLTGIGRIYDDLGERQKALEFFNQSLPLYRALGDKPGEALILNNIGSVYLSTGEKQKAIEFFNQALLLHRALDNKRGEATTLTNIGLVYFSTGEKQKALEFYNQALPLRRAVGDKGGEAATLTNIGLVYSSTGENQKALEFYNQALPLHRAVGDRRGEATTLTNIGSVYSSTGEKQKALEFFNQALTLYRAVGDRGGEATTLTNIGSVYSSTGEKQKALEFYNQALPLLRAIGDRGREGLTLNNLGLVYDDLGEKQKALEFYNQALPLLRTVGDRAGEALALNNIGSVYNDLGEKYKALEFYNQALTLHRAIANKSGEATTLNSIGFGYHYLGEKQKALEFYNQALTLYRAVGDRGGEATTLNNIGPIYEDLGEKQKALEFYNQALTLRRAVSNRGGEAITLANIADLERKNGNLQAAISNIQKAIAIIEDSRSKIVIPKYRTSYFAEQQSIYELYIDLLMSIHRQDPSQKCTFNSNNIKITDRCDAIALRVNESARARTLVELLQEANANITAGVDEKLGKTERALIQELNALEFRKYSLNQETTAPSVDKQIEEINQKIKEKTNQLEIVQTEIHAKNPRYAQLTQPQPLTLQQIQSSVLDDDTLLLQYSLGRDRSYLWLVSKTSINSYELPKGEEIEKLVKQYVALLKNPGYLLESQRGISTEPRPTSAIAQSPTKLSQILLQPVAAKLGSKRLLIVADGALQFLPFATLPIPGNEKSTLLLSNHEIVYSPSATTNGILRQQHTPTVSTTKKTLAVLADPVFGKDDDRLKKQPTRGVSSDDLNNLGLQRAARNTGLTFQRLPYTRIEAEQILKLVPENQRYSAFDFAANLSQAVNPQLSQYKIVHFATHGILDTISPELSGVVLSLFDDKGNPQNGFLRLRDIFNLKLPAELVVLSACETGLGETVKGEGLVGLTRGFMYAGSPRLIVSLWSVSDAGTSVLMNRFYQKMLQENMKPAAALRAAQLEMLKDPKYSAPFYWSAFTFQGEWQ